METAHLDRHRRGGHVPDVAKRLPHLDGSGSGVVHVRPGISSRRAGHWPFPLRRPQMGGFGGWCEFASVTTNEVDYNHSIGALLCGGAHRSVDADRFGESCTTYRRARRLDFNSARSGHSDGAGAGGSGRSVSRWNRMEAFGTWCCTRGADDSDRLEHAAPPEALSATAY